MKDYLDLYSKCDALLLADGLEKFRNNSLKNYGLCPSHYLSAPALRLDAMLFIPDPDMYIFFGKCTRVVFFLLLINIAKPTISI